MIDKKAQLVQKWLELFGTPATFLVKKEGSEKKGITPMNTKQYLPLEGVLDVNNGRPYLAAFTPNGNYGKVNVIGKEVHHEKSDAEAYVAALVIDLDLDKSGFKTKGDYFKYITDEIENSHLKIGFINETGGGYHAYLFIREEDRYNVGKLLQGSNFKNIEEKLAEQFRGGDKSSHSIAKLMRLPYSKYRKNSPMNTMSGFECKLMKFTRDSRGNLVMQNMINPEQINLDGVEQLSLTGVKAMLGSIEDEKNYDVKYETQNVKDNSKYNETCEEVNKLSIIEVIEKLANYSREYNGNTYIFKVYGGSHIGFLMNGSNELVRTDGYVINRNGNYVQCFSDILHPIDERPRGQVYPFLHYYFKGERGKLNAFLEKEYGITFSHKSDGAIESYLSFDTDSGTFDFSSDGVWCATNKGTKRIFPTPFTVKGMFQTRYTLQGETVEPNSYYLVNVGNNRHTEFKITPVFDRKKFNMMYGGMGLATKASDIELIDLWHGLSVLASEGTIPVYDYKYVNGYYNNLYIIGNTAYNTDGEEVDVEPMNIILDTPIVERYHTSEDVTVKEFGAKFRQLYSDRESMVMFTTFITLLTGHNFRVPELKNYITQVLVPGLFLSGKSQSGKTTAITLCKHGFELSTDSKKFSVKGVTAQPINQASTDARLLHLEERTGRISEDKENIVRNILNKSTASRGLVSGDNVFYNYKSSVIIDGETSPSSESVVNRCIYIPFYKEDRTGNMTLINSFSTLSYLKDFIRKLYQIDKSKIRPTFQSKQKLLMENGLNDREANNYSFILCVNEWFDIYEEEELMKAIRQNMELDKTVAETRLDLSSLFSELLIEKRVWATKTYTDEYVTQIFVPLSDEALQQHKVDIMGIIRRYGNDKVRAKGSNLIITYDSRDTSEKNVELYQILNLFSSHIHQDNNADLVLS